MLKKKLDLNYISRVLLRIFKKLHRFKFNSKNLYIFFLLYHFSNINRSDVSSPVKYAIGKNQKYYYSVYFIIMKKVLDNYLNLKKIDNNINMDKFRLSLDHKNNLLFIYLDHFSSEINYLKKIKYDFFFRFKKFSVYLEEEYKFRIDVFNFLFYGKYIEYIRKSIYNEYLTFAQTLFSYPLLKSFLRLIIYSRLKKMEDNNIKFSTNQAILKNYHIYDDFDEMKIFKSNSILSNSNSSSFLINNILNTNLIKYLIIWKNRKFYYYLDQVFYKFFKSNVILPAYYVNLNYEEEDDITDTNKLNMMGLYSLYWQMNRYGFNFNYYYYLNSLMFSMKNINLNNIAFYNIYFLKFILLDNLYYYWIFWFKLIKLILLDFIYSAFFKFFKFNKLNLKRKKLRFKRLLSFKLLMQTYSFVFLPVSLEFYYNDLNLLEILKKKKLYLDNILVNIFFGYYLNLSEHLNFNLEEIYKKINLDNILNNNLDYYLNLLFFFISKKIGKYYFTNFYSQYKGLSIFLMKILKTSKPSYSNNYYLTKDTLSSLSFRYLDFNLSKYRGINYFYSYRNQYIWEYLWDFEFYMIYSFYLIIIFRYNQLYLKIFIGKFLLLCGSK